MNITKKISATIMAVAMAVSISATAYAAPSGAVAAASTTSTNEYVVTEDSGNISINGKPIDLNFDFSNSFYISEGSYSTRMKLNGTKDTRVVGCQVVNYRTDWENAYNKKGAVLLSLQDANGWLYRYSRGVYKGNDYNEWYTDQVAVVDPDTGKVFDLLDYNYYYLNHYRHFSYSNVSNTSCRLG